MFNRLTSFKGSPDNFQLTLKFLDSDAAHHSSEREHASDHIPGVLTKESVIVAWQSTEDDAAILARVAAAAQDPEVRHEEVQVTLETEGNKSFPDRIVDAARFQAAVQATLQIKSSPPLLRSVELIRTAGSGVISTTLGLGIWNALDVSHVTQLVCADGATSLWDATLLLRFSSLRVLNLNHALLHTLPGVIGSLTALQELHLVGNHLKILPPELGKLHNLRLLHADDNEIALLPGELRRCSALEEFSLENNRLTSVLLDFAALRELRVLRLGGNPLEFLPEIAPCSRLRSLSVVNLRVAAAVDYSSFEVILSSPSGPSATLNISLFESKPMDKLRPIFALMLRRSSGHHPLLAGALRHLAENPKNRDLMAKQEGALQQLLLMALSDDAVCVAETCKTLAVLAQHSPSLAEAILDVDVGSIVRLLVSDEPTIVEAGLHVIAAISSGSELATERLLSYGHIFDRLVTLASDDSYREDVRVGALVAVGNIAFSCTGKARLRSHMHVMEALLNLCHNSGSKTPSLRVKSAAVRALAILGTIDDVFRAVGRSLPENRGLRILSMDGGGMKGMATVKLLRALQQRTGRPIHTLFDLIVGTSTGGLLAVAMGLRKFTMDECESIYKVLGKQVFSRPAPPSEKDESWMEAFYRTFQSKTEHVRAVVVGYKHDATVYETLLKQYCTFKDNPQCLSDALIDTAALNVPRVALVSTLASACPAEPFVFRNYEVPSPPEFGHLHRGSSKHATWQAVRASSAAIYYLDDFMCGEDKFHDGAVVANNPSIIALQEARALWPETPIDVFISLGTGSTPSARRDKALSGFMDAGSILIESSTSVDRAHETLSTFAPLIQGLKYFRLNPVDPRCAMELDEINPEKWAALDAAVEEFIQSHGTELDAAAAAILGAQSPGGPLQTPGFAPRMAPPDQKKICLPLFRRGLLVISSNFGGAEPTPSEQVAASCARLPFCSACLDVQQAAEVIVNDGRTLPQTPSPRPSPSSDGTEAKPHRKRRIEENDAANTSTPKPLAAATGLTAFGDASPSGAAIVEVNIGSALGSVINWFTTPTKQIDAAEQRDASGDEQIAATSSPSGRNQHDAHSIPVKGKRHLENGESASDEMIKNWSARKAGKSDATTTRKGARLEEPRLVNPSLLIEQALLGATPDVGIVHLSLMSSPDGLVLRWRESFTAVTVPSPEADAIVTRAGYDPSTTSLPALFDSSGGEIFSGNARFRAQSTLYRHSSPGWRSGGGVVLLVQTIHPEELLTTAVISRMRPAFCGRVVVTTEVLPQSFIDAFASAGCLAVLAPVETLADISTRVTSEFFRNLYEEMHAGTDCKVALRKAGEACPHLDGALTVHACS